MHLFQLIGQHNEKCAYGGETVEKEEQKTNIEALKEQARKSGLSYNEAIAYIAKTTGGHGTNIYSDTDVDAVKMKNEQSENNK